MAVQSLVTFDSDHKPKANVAFKITALVTESDQSQAKPVLEKIATFVGQQKQTIVTAATQPSPK